MQASEERKTGELSVVANDFRLFLTVLFFGQMCPELFPVSVLQEHFDRRAV